MHIAIVRTIFDRHHGGAERYAVSLAQSRQKTAYEITVVCVRANEEDVDGMNVLRVTRPKVLGPWKHRWFAARAGEAACNSGADRVLCLARALNGDVLRLGDGLHRSWLGARYAELAQRKRALWNPRHRQILKLEAEMFRPGRFGWYVANSEMIKRAVVHMYSVDPSRIVVVPNGVDTDRFSLNVQTFGLREQHGIDTDAKIVLFSGMDFRRKGLLRAVDGFISACKSRTHSELPLHFVCVGKGNTEEAKSTLNDAGLASQATFLEPQKDIERWYSVASVFVLPTMHDPSANAVTESLACGTPVVTSAENGARQHIIDGVNGFVVGEMSRLGEKINEVLRAEYSCADVNKASKLVASGENADRILELLTNPPTIGDESLGQILKDLSGQGLAAPILMREIRKRVWQNNIDIDPREMFRQLR
ncbi:MAG: glycosyltransferase family 4 protein [Planctomycetota bacterium]|jgi:UDP-glucose:(heptosyl)LPS alpha-1,3-glucosyltransferase